MSKDDFIIADEDIDALMEELTHFSRSEAEPFFSDHRSGDPQDFEVRGYL